MDKFTAVTKTNLSNLSSPTKVDSGGSSLVMTEEYERDMLKLSQDIVSMHQNQRKHEKSQKKTMDKMDEQIQGLQRTVDALLERDKQAQLFNEMNIQKINDLEAQNQELQV